MDKALTIYEDNAAYVAQMNNSYVKTNLKKHFLPKHFYPHEQQENGNIEILKILTDLFTKALPASMFENKVHVIGMRRHKVLLCLGGDV